MNGLQHKRRSQGFTLVELVIYFALLSVFLSFTIPASLDLYQKTQQRVIQAALGSAVRQARLLAMTEGSVLVLAPCCLSNNWSDGLGLYRLSGFKQNPRAKPIYQWHWSTKLSQVTWQGFQSQNALYFMPDAGRNAVNGVFSIQVAMQPEMNLVVSRLGYIH